MVFLKREFLIPAILISTGYLLLNIYFTNPSLINQTFFSNFSLSYKEAIILGLIEGLGTAMSTINLAFLIIISILTGLNLSLILRAKYFSSKLPVHFAMGGSFLGAATTGCVSCGLPLLGVLGFSGTLVYLPLKGLEVSVLAIILLSISFYILLKKSQEVCKL